MSEVATRHLALPPVTSPFLDPPPVETDALVDGGTLAAGEAGRRAIRGGATRLVAFGLSVVFSVVSSAVAYRYLGVVRTGDYVKVTSLVALCAGLTDAGLSAIGVREFSTRDREGRRLFMRDLSGLRLALALSGALVAVAFAAVAGYGWMLVLGTAVAGVAMILVVLEDTYAISLTAQLRVTSVGLADLLRVFVLSLGVTVLAVAHDSLLTLFAVAVPAAAFAAIVNGVIVRHDITLLPRLRPRQWAVILRETISFSIATAITAAYFRVALIVVSLVSDGHQIGYFSLSFRIIEVLVSVPVLLVGVTFPIFARAAQDDRARLDYAIGRVFDALWLVGVGVAVGMIVGAPVVIEIFGTKFAPAEIVLRIQGVALMASFVGSVFVYALLSLHRHRAILAVSLAALIMSGVLSGVLASLDGARGAAIGTALSECAFVSMLALATRRSGLNPLISWRNVPLSLLAGAAGVAVLAIPSLPAEARLVAGIAVYSGALLVLRVVPDEILEQLPRRRTQA